VTSVLVARTFTRAVALPLGDVLFVCRPLPVEPVKDAPPFVEGVSLLRGAPTPVVSLGSLLGEKGRGPEGRFVVIRVATRKVALAMQAVLGVRDLDASAIVALPPLLGQGPASPLAALATLDGELVSVLSSARILTEAVS
jgi:purine-binding chemotaxis protein CheW